MLASPSLVFFTAADPLASFSQDMSVVDMKLPMTCIAQIIIIAVSSRYLGATIPFVLAVFFFTQRLYIRTSRQLRFLDIEAKGPLYTEFIDLLNGLPVVRAFNMQGAFQQRLAAALDTSQKPFHLLFCVQRWLGLVLKSGQSGPGADPTRSHDCNAWHLGGIPRRCTDKPDEYWT
jgi:ABC-type multidrug transport system fused ATPase/permease subunit